MSSSSSSKHRFFWGLVIIFIGLLFLFNNFDIFDIGDFIGTFWPLILVIIGIKIILGRKNHGHKTEDLDTSEFTSDSLSESRFIGDVHLKVKNDQFKGGNVSNSIGDITLDLSEIALKEGEQNLTLSGFIGDVTLLPPKNVPFSIHASVSLGDLNLFGQKDDGFGVSRDYKSEGFDSVSTKLNISISYFIGDVKVL